MIELAFKMALTSGVISMTVILLIACVSLIFEIWK